MINKRRPYPGAKAPAKGKRPGTEKFVAICRNKWGFSNLGTWVVRDMRGRPGVLSVHATGRAADLGYTNRDKAMEACRFLVDNNTALGVTLINDYLYGKFGRTWMCDRQAWKVHEKNVLGPARGQWLHVELDSWAADDPQALTAAWRSIKTP